MAAIRWGLSVLDWRSHAIDERRYHPVGVYKAECGHLLMMVTTLHEAPNGKSCEACAAQQFVRAVKDDPDQIRADSDARTDCRCPAPSLAPAAVSSDAVTSVTLRIVAALPTPGRCFPGRAHSHCDSAERRSRSSPTLGWSRSDRSTTGHDHRPSARKEISELPVTDPRGERRPLPRGEPQRCPRVVGRVP